MNADPIKGTGARRWAQLTARLAATWAQHAAPCWLCGQPIDYQADRRRHPNALNVDHVIPRSARPDLAFARSNLRPAHRHCNLSRGNKTHPGHRISTREW